MLRAAIIIARGRRAFAGASALAALMLVGALVSADALASAGSLVLPDNRAWEQVSPVDKRGNDIDHEVGTMAALNGNRLLFHSQGPFAGAESALGVDGLWYLANRTPSGWMTRSQMPSGGTFTLGFNGYQGFSEDLSKGVLAWREDQITGGLDPQAPLGGLNLYLRDTSAGTFELLNGLDNVGENNGFVWGSKDFGKLALQSGGHLTTDSPCANAGSDSVKCAYEWDHGELRLASVLPDGTPVTGTVGNAHLGNYEHALSDDGTRLFFESPFLQGNGGGALYVREDGTTTVPVSESERTLPGGAAGGTVKYQSAEAAHGDRVLFSTKNSLVNADTDATNDLYLYDFTKPAGERLTLVSEDNDPEAPQGAAVDGGYEGGTTEYGGVVGTSEDLHRVYFVANNQIVPGAPEALGPKLYLWDDSGASPEISYIGTLEDGNSGDLFMWSAPSIGVRDFMRTSRISRDGRYLAFASAGQLPGIDNEGRKQAYRYDAVTHELDCISCVEDAFPANGAVGFQLVLQFNASPLNHRPSNVTDNGQVFFETSRGLVPRDSNGKMDVYEFEEGQLHLISRGTGAEDSYFVDATPSGSDVFFTTADRLVGWDNDSNYDAYDARVDGGLPEPPPSPPPCEGDACQPPPRPPGESSLASESFQGSGNVVSARKPKRSRCAGNKVRRHGKCQKRRAVNRSAAKGGGR